MSWEVGRDTNDGKNDDKNALDIITGEERDSILNSLLATKMDFLQNRKTIPHNE